MGNCLVTKLKDVVNNDNLDKFGVITIKVHEEENFDPASDYLQIDNRYISDSDGLTIRTDGNCLSLSNDLSNLTNSITLSKTQKAEMTIYYVNGNYNIYIESKYLNCFRSINFRGSLEFNIDDTYYMNNQYTTIVSNYATWETNKASDDILGLAIYSQNVNGNLINIAHCVQLISLSIQRGNFVGDLVDFAEAQVNTYNRTSGTIEISANGKLTINGNIMYATHYIQYDPSFENGYRITE